MSVGLYMDVNVPWAITNGLRRRGVDVLTAQEDGMRLWDDPDLLDRAMQLNRAVFTQDRDFLREAVRRQRNGIPFAGIVFAHQWGPSDRQCIDDLELISQIEAPADWLNRLEYLPL